MSNWNLKYQAIKGIKAQGANVTKMVRSVAMHDKISHDDVGW